MPSELKEFMTQLRKSVGCPILYPHISALNDIVKGWKTRQTMKNDTASIGIDFNQGQNTVHCYKTFFFETQMGYTDAYEMVEENLNLRGYTLSYIGGSFRSSINTVELSIVFKTKNGRWANVLLVIDLDELPYEQKRGLVPLAMDFDDCVMDKMQREHFLHLLLYPHEIPTPERLPKMGDDDYEIPEPDYMFGR